MNSYVHGLRAEVDRARGRVQYARRELARAEHNADNGDPRAARTLRKLEEDLAKAEKDASWAEHRLADAMASKAPPRPHVYNGDAAA